jgi:hypothetical protein
MNPRFKKKKVHRKFHHILPNLSPLSPELFLKNNNDNNSGELLSSM